ncbi:hypothetical protein HanHA300_Chr09g0311731 [Helianthus annuus]|nr:hypothetical protein HanHA300_Chr09g0311731 [Helianthus annuus]
MVRKGSTSPFVPISSCLHRRQWRQSCRKAKVILGPCETLTPRAFLNSTRRSLVIKSFASRRKRISRLLFLLWCRRWQVDAAGAGEQKRPKLRRTRTAAISQPKPAVVTEPHAETFSFFDARSSPPRDADVDMGVNKEFKRSPSIEVVTPPSTHAEDTGKKAAG